MKIYDLTKTLSEQTEVYAGDPPFARSHMMRLPGDMCNVSYINLCLHTGTHADAPFHFIENGDTVDMLSLEHFAGRAYVATIKADDGIIKTDDIREALTCLEGENIFILYSGHESFDNIPVFENEIGALLASYGINTFASDLTSVEPAEVMHRDLLGRGIVIIEALTALSSLPEKHIFFSAAPLKIKGGDGAPIRAYAIVE
ncbi:MAG: cyclase family protein [Eubacteriales bacterium]